MNPTRGYLHDTLVAATSGRGVASVAVIDHAGASPRAVWTPESALEPAFLAYSITKTLVAACVIALAEDGRLALDDSLARWFPHIEHADRISLRQLLNHSAGIPDYGGNRAYHDGVRTSPSIPWTFERFAAETFDKGLAFEPGHGWAYSNPGFMLLKRIAEDVSGLSLRALIDERIVRPLDLQRTFVAESVADLAELAPGTSKELSPDRAPRDVRALYHPGWVSHGVVVSTASDIVRFFDALFRGAIVPTRAVQQMLSWVAVPVDPKQAPADDPLSRLRKPSYGLGLMGDPESPWGIIAGHNGGGPCYNASVFRSTDLGGACVCVMAAIEEGFNAERVVFGIFDRYASG